MSTATPIRILPTPDQIIRRIDACRDEIAALKVMLRAAQAADRAEEARRERSLTTGEAAHA